LSLALRVRSELHDFEALFPKVDGCALVTEPGEKVGELSVRSEHRLRLAPPPRNLRLRQLRLDEREHRRRDADLLLLRLLRGLDLGAMREVEEVDERLDVPRDEDVDA